MVRKTSKCFGEDVKQNLLLLIGCLTILATFIACGSNKDSDRPESHGEEEKVKLFESQPKHDDSIDPRFSVAGASNAQLEQLGLQGDGYYWGYYPSVSDKDPFRRNILISICEGHSNWRFCWDSTRHILRSGDSASGDASADLSHYARANAGTAYFVGNETNLGPFLPADQYAEMYHHIWKAVKSGDSSSKVGFCNIAHVNNGNYIPGVGTANYCDDAGNWYRKKYGNYPQIDLLLIHQYAGGSLKPNDISRSMEAWANQLNAFIAWRNRTDWTKGKPIWLTEFGHLGAWCRDGSSSGCPMQAIKGDKNPSNDYVHIGDDDEGLKGIMRLQTEWLRRSPIEKWFWFGVGMGDWWGQHGECPQTGWLFGQVQPDDGNLACRKATGYPNQLGEYYRSLALKSTLVQQMMAYRRYWTLDIEKGYQPTNPGGLSGTDFSINSFYANGPCRGHEKDCHIDDLAIGLVKSGSSQINVQQIIAYGKYWTLDINKKYQPINPGGIQGTPLTSNAIFAKGPCLGHEKDCRIDGLAIGTVKRGNTSSNVQQIIAYGKYWTLDIDNGYQAINPGGLQGTPLTSNPIYAKGPCLGHEQDCRIDSFAIGTVKSGNALINVQQIIAYGKYWTLDINNNYNPINPGGLQGTPLRSNSLFLKGPCQGHEIDCQVEAFAIGSLPRP